MPVIPSIYIPLSPRTITEESRTLFVPVQEQGYETPSSASKLRVGATLAKDLESLTSCGVSYSPEMLMINDEAPRMASKLRGDDPLKLELRPRYKRSERTGPLLSRVEMPDTEQRSWFESHHYRHIHDATGFITPVSFCKRRDKSETDDGEILGSSLQDDSVPEHLLVPKF